MAIFTDSNRNQYIGVLYIKYGDAYSGNFLRPSERSVRILSQGLRWAARLQSALAACILGGDIIEVIVGARDEFNAFFACISCLLVLIGVLYLVVGPIALIRTKKRLSKVILVCDRPLSYRMYAVVFFNCVLLLASAFSMPAMSLTNDGSFVLILLGPALLGLSLAMRVYSGKE